jgi:uncharacterized membrane protein
MNQKLTDRLAHLFLTGLVTILPITLTIALFNSSLKMVIAWLEPLQKLINPHILTLIPHAEVVFAILIIMIIGTLYNMFLLDHIIHLLELLVKKIPLVRPVYIGIKQLIHAFGSQDKVNFKKVVILEFPRSGIFSLGFLTSEIDSTIAPTQDKKYFSVFIPTTPNPTSGFCIIAPEDELLFTQWSQQEAMTMIISGGIIQPNIAKKQPN